MGNFFAALLFFIVSLVGSFSIGMSGDFIAGATLFFALFWFVGLTPTVLVRFVFARKPLSRGAAFGLTILFLFLNVFILAMLRGQNLTSGRGADIWMVCLTFCTYNILRMGKKGSAVPTPAQAARTEFPSESQNSTRVKDTVVTVNKPPVAAGLMETPTRQKKENPTAMNDDEFYEQVGKELEANDLQTGLWTRAFAEADGDENRAKAIYIKLRVAQLADNSSRQLEETKQNELSALKKREEQECATVRNFEQKMSAFENCAKKGDAEAQYNLGLIHYSGNGVVWKDYKEAAKWFRLAADQGNADAQNSLGVICFNGDGTARDYIQAYAWFFLAAEQGNEKAKKSLSMIIEKMTPKAIEEGRQKALEYAKKVVRKENRSENGPAL